MSFFNNKRASKVSGSNAPAPEITFNFDRPEIISQRFPGHN